MPFVAAYYAYRAYGIESARDERLARALRQEQGSRVAIWAFHDPHPVTGAPAEVEGCELRNSSELPVYDTRIFSYRCQATEPAKPANHYDLGTLRPDTSPRRIALCVDRQFSYVYAVQFRDASGQIWHRTRGGVLEEGPMPGRDLFDVKYFPDDDDLLQG